MREGVPEAMTNFSPTVHIEVRNGKYQVGWVNDGKTFEPTGPLHDTPRAASEYADRISDPAVIRHFDRVQQETEE